MAKFRNTGEAYADTRPALLETFRVEAKKVMRDHAEDSASVMVSSLLPRLVDLVPEDLFELADPAKHGRVFLHGEIEEDTVAPLQAKMMAVHLSIGKSVPLSLSMSSFGGDIVAGLALVATINEVRRAGRRVHIHVQGAAHSTASFILQAADHRTMEPTAALMIHKSLWSTGHLSLDEHADYIMEAKRQYDTVLTLYSARTGKPVSHYRKLLYKRDWHLSAKQALAEGLVDRVLPVPAFG